MGWTTLLARARDLRDRAAIAQAVGEQADADALREQADLLTRDALLRRESLLTRKSQLSRSGLRPVSDKRRAEAAKRRAVVNAVRERDGDRCFARELIPHECRGPLDCHEVIPRSAWPGGHLVASNCRLVCRAVHAYLTDHPSAAKAVGLHGFSWELKPCVACGRPTNSELCSECAERAA